MKAVVLGSGGWGTALALVLCDNGHDVTLWSRTPAKAEEMARTRENPLLKGVPLPEALNITGDLKYLEGAELVVSAPPSFAVRETGGRIAPYLRPDSVLVTVSKGIERDTNLRMSQILREATQGVCPVVALSGPSHAEEVGLRLPTGCVAACPAGALQPDGTVDARRCLSYLTIEHRGPLPEGTDLHGCLYGCDACAMACPHNACSTASETLPELRPRPAVAALTAREAASMTQEQFSAIFTHSAIKRAKLAGLQRNACALMATQLGHLKKNE